MCKSLQHFATWVEVNRHAEFKLSKSFRRTQAQSSLAVEAQRHVLRPDVGTDGLTGKKSTQRVRLPLSRTVNLDIIALRNVLKRAIDDGWIKTQPTENLRPLKVDQRKRGLVMKSELETLLTAARALPLSGELLIDVLRLMMTCGSRIAEFLRLRWSDVDFSQRQITIGSDGPAKNRKHRTIDFNEPLES